MADSLALLFAPMFLTGRAGHRVTGKRSTQAANRRAGRRGAPAGWEFVHICIDQPPIARLNELNNLPGPSTPRSLRPASLEHGRRPREPAGRAISRAASDER